MAAPDPSAITVATDALRSDAAVWEAQAAAMREIAHRAAELRLTVVQAGIFGVVADGYRQVVDQVTARSAEAVGRMTAVRDTLHACADTYDREDAQHLHALTGLY